MDSRNDYTVDITQDMIVTTDVRQVPSEMSEFFLHRAWNSSSCAPWPAPAELVSILVSSSWDMIIIAYVWRYEFRMRRARRGREKRSFVRLAFTQLIDTIENGYFSHEVRKNEWNQIATPSSETRLRILTETTCSPCSSGSNTLSQELRLTERKDVGPNGN